MARGAENESFSGGRNERNGAMTLSKPQAAVLMYVAENGNAEGIYYERDIEGNASFRIAAIDRTIESLQKRGLLTDPEDAEATTIDIELTEAGRSAFADALLDERLVTNADVARLLGSDAEAVGRRGQKFLKRVLGVLPAPHN
jgi:DNA-binding MarR family transcriptional regulator